MEITKETEDYSKIIFVAELDKVWAEYWENTAKKLWNHTGWYKLSLLYIKIFIFTSLYENLDSPPKLFQFQKFHHSSYTQVKEAVKYVRY